MSKETDVVSWAMMEDAIVKLEKKGLTYDLSDKVVKFLESKGLFDKLDDKKVDVEIDESKGENGLITRLSLSDAKDKPIKEEKDEKPPITEPQDCPSASVNLVVKELTVGGVSVDKNGVIFKEEENVWYSLDSTINVQKFKDECTKKKIEVSILPQNKGNDVIKGYILKEEGENTPKDIDKKQTKKTYNDTQLSIEAQASMNSANRVTQAMVDKDTKPEFVEKLITRIAEHNFKTIQKLKNKE